MSDLYSTGIRPTIDKYLLSKAQERRSYGDYWSASSAGYCYKKNILERLKTPYTADEDVQARQQRVFQSGHLFHEFYQKITKETGLSIAQELEVQDDDLMIRGHIDDLILIEGKLILYDYKTRNSRSFNYAKQPMETHRYQVGTYMYILRKNYLDKKPLGELKSTELVKEARTLNIEKDTLRQAEVQYMYTEELEKEVLDYWNGLNEAWDKFKKEGILPKCTCEGFMATERYNPFYYKKEPCSTKWFKKWLEERKEKT